MKFALLVFLTANPLSTWRNYAGQSPVVLRNPRDQAAWFLKCRALTSKQWIDDVETLVIACLCSGQLVAAASN